MLLIKLMLNTLNQIQENVKMCQLQLEKRRAESEEQFSGNYANQQAEYAQDFRMAR